jgi:hypothetical protein
VSAPAGQYAYTTTLPGRTNLAPFNVTLEIPSGTNLPAVTSSGFNGQIYVDGVNYPKTAAGINAALAACTVAGGTKVILLPGTFTITATLTWSGNSCDLEGAGRNITVLQMVDPTNNLPGITPSGHSRIEHFTLLGTGAGACPPVGTNTANGITAGGIPNVTINDMEIAGWSCQLISSGKGSQNWKIINNYLHNGANEGILYGQSSGPGAIISGNHIWNNAKNGIDIGGSTFVTITNNDVYQNGGSGPIGLDQDGIIDFSNANTGYSSHNLIVGNNIHDNNTNGISIGTAGAGDTGGQIIGVTVTGNNIHNNGYGNGVTRGGAGIIVRNNGGAGTITGVTITGNTITGSVGTGVGNCNGDGICLLSAGGAGAFNTIVVSGNTSVSNGNYGLELINSNIFDATVTGNSLINNTTGAFTDTSSRSVFGCNHTQTTSGGCELINPVINGTEITATPASANLVATVASGTATMTTALIAAGACGTTVTVSATNVLGSDVIILTPNASEGTNAVLRPSYWPTINNVNFAWCNGTAAGITPVAEVLNWRVVR